MAGASLIVVGKGQSGEVPLDPRGVVIGRHPPCGLVLDSLRVSRRHARIFQDPFGRWIVEDLGSRNGVLVEGRPVQAHALLPGQGMQIGPFTLTLAAAVDDRPAPAAPQTDTTTHLLAEGGEMEILPATVGGGAALSRARLVELNAIVDALAAVGGAAELYPAVCRHLAKDAGRAAAVVRVPAPGAPAGSSPQVLAWHVGGRDEMGLDDAGSSGLYLSRRALEAARTSDELVLARSVHSAAGQLTLTLVDDRHPRAVLCMAVARQGESADVLYVDLPMEAVGGDMPEFLQAVARQVRLARRSLLVSEMRAERMALDHELAMARDIQARLTPRQMPQVAGLDVAIYCQPALWVGGDYCDVWLLPDGRLAFAVGDVCGKGLPAALVMANLQAALRTAATFCTDPSLAVDHVNQHLGRHLPEGMFVTLFLGFLSAGDGKLEYVNAGHIPPLLLDGSGRPAGSLGRPANPVLGVFDRPFQTAAEPIPPGAGLLAVSDGITEAPSPSGELFSAAGLEAVLAEGRRRSAREVVEAVSSAAARFRGDRPQHDDVTVLALLRQSAAAARSPAGPATDVTICR